jgi:cellulose biosynthesis protein BcsQ
MGLIDKFIDRDKTSQITAVNPREVFNNILRQSSGSALTRELKYDIFYQIIAFKGVVDGVGTSTIVANTAVALANLGLTICVIDTSVLQPVQDILLKTGIDDKDPETVLDWFDMPFTKKSPLHVSGINKNISVLGFRGKNRGIIDVLSTNDSESLVDMALTELHTKFDVILIDCCHELTSINTAALQMSQKVIQVWNDAPQVMANIDNFITNCVTLSCPLDKMRYVVYSKMSKEVMGNNLDSILSQYRFRKLSETKISESVYFYLASGKPLYQLESTDKDIVDYTDTIIAIVCHICNIDKNGNKKKLGSISSQDIMDGKVEGTTTKKLMDRAKEQGYNTAIQIDSTEDMDLFLEGGKK